MSTTFRTSRSVLLEQPFIVVGVDGSPCSHLALRWALAEAIRTGAAIDAVHVWSDPWAITGPPSLLGAGREGVAKMQEELARAVDAAVEAAGAGGVPVVEQVLPGDPAGVLLEESRGAVMLVVGTRGLGHGGRELLGPVSRHCAQHARLPLVLVPDVTWSEHDGASAAAMSGSSVSSV
jgi:nucleotide-binding universal stress UspA family protein